MPKFVVDASAQEAPEGCVKLDPKHLKTMRLTSGDNVLVSRPRHRKRLRKISIEPPVVTRGSSAAYLTRKDIQGLKIESQVNDVDIETVSGWAAYFRRWLAILVPSIAIVLTTFLVISAVTVASVKEIHEEDVSELVVGLLISAGCVHVALAVWQGIPQLSQTWKNPP